MIHDYYSLKQLATDNVVTVTFEKVDGTLREMRCTLQPSYLPQLITEDASEIQTKRLRNEDVLSVWDIDNGGWRSFRIDSVKQIVVG